MQTNESGRAAGDTIAPTPQIFSAVELRPYSFRLPANGEQDPWFGCTRTFWAERIREAPTKPAEVKSWSHRRTLRDKRGIRLIDYFSAREYMEQTRAEAERKFNLPTWAGDGAEGSKPMDEWMTNPSTQ